ncbi:hypothetical protein [Hypericibacter terrae]|uniref:hypothetical protein n=1 Tax=Hypericibacter terrae TaxID=2602015 RepID=UPI001247B120|nr:hypothetical protein [Hypericibacter terrae]
MESTVEHTSYFVPCVSVLPGFDELSINVQGYRLHRRAWEVSTFDLATLATRHKLHLPYQLMDVFLSGPTHLEIEITAASSREDAMSRIERFRAMLYINGVSPFIIPFVASHSFNHYAGINSRDSDLLISKLPEGMRSGIVSASSSVEVWPYELSLMTLVARESKPVTAEIAHRAAWQAQQARSLEQKHPELAAVRFALTAAPQITQLGSSLLHLWTGMESLFPNVRAEVSFRISLLLAELVSPIASPSVVYEAAKRSYTHRSNAAHGNLKKIGDEEWREAWELLCNCLLAVLHRGDLPGESALLTAMLAKSEMQNHG